jgi:hypothetical protein
MNPAEKQKVTGRDISPIVNKGMVVLRQNRSEAVNCLERMGDGSLPKQQPRAIAQSALCDYRLRSHSLSSARSHLALKN